jgi:hypothetical protein
MVAVLSWPPILRLLLVGGVSAVLAAAVLFPLRKKRIYPVLVGLGVALGIAASAQFFAQAARQVEIDNTIGQLKTDPLFAALFKYHPDAEKTFRDGYATILKATPQDEKASAFATLTTSVVIHYVRNDLPNASDSAVHTLLLTDIKAMTELKNSPQDCLGYFNGENFNAGVLPVSDVEGIKKTEADIIESAAVNPTPQIAVTDGLLHELGAAYQQDGYPMSDLANFETPGKLTAAQQCQAGINIYTALLSLNPRDASIILKSLQ